MHSLHCRFPSASTRVADIIATVGRAAHNCKVFSRFVVFSEYLTDNFTSSLATTMTTRTSTTTYSISTTASTTTSTTTMQTITTADQEKGVCGCND